MFVQERAGERVLPALDGKINTEYRQHPLAKLAQTVAIEAFKPIQIAPKVMINLLPGLPQRTGTKPSGDVGSRLIKS